MKEIILKRSAMHVRIVEKLFTHSSQLNMQESVPIGRKAFAYIHYRKTFNTSTCPDLHEINHTG